MLYVLLLFLIRGCLQSGFHTETSELVTPVNQSGPQVMAELLAEGMGESLMLVACCTGTARTGTHSSVAAMSSFLRLSIDEVLLGFSIPRRPWQVGAVRSPLVPIWKVGSISGIARERF